MTVRLLLPLKFSDGGGRMELAMNRGARIGEVIDLVASRSNIDKYGRNQVIALVGEVISQPDDLIEGESEIKVMLRPMGG